MKSFVFIILSFLVTFLDKIAEATQCHNYPKIIGGYNGATFIYDIDANLANDIIVMGGSTKDRSLGGISTAPIDTFFPILSAHKMSSTQVIWAHRDMTTLDREIIKVKLSNNGKHLIVAIHKEND